jgi:hypothetical protein
LVSVAEKGMLCYVRCKENCIDRSVIEPIVIDFCNDDSDDDTGWSIIILSIIDRAKM